MALPTFKSQTCLFLFRQISATLGLPRWLSGKESACSARDTGDSGSIPGSRRSPGGGNGNPLQYSCLDNPMDRGACGLQSVGLQRIRHFWASEHACNVRTSICRTSAHAKVLNFLPFVEGFPVVLLKHFCTLTISFSSYNNQERWVDQGSVCLYYS